MGIGLDLATFIGQLVSFLILLGLLVCFGYRPVRKMLKERSDRIREGLEQAEATGREYERAQAEAEAQISKAREEARLIVAEAGQAREKLMKEARSEARQEARAMMERNKSELEQERREMIADLRREFADAAILAAEKVIGESLDREKHWRIIEQALEESESLRETRG
jgi:F-type H+-transporting ATPase subunit b